MLTELQNKQCTVRHEANWVQPQGRLMRWWIRQKYSVVYLFNVCVWWFISTSPQIQLCKNAEREAGFEKTLNLADMIPNNFSAILPTLLNLQLHILSGQEIPRVCLA